MRILVLAVGKLKPPFQDDVQHYLKMIARHARVEIVELREDEEIERRLPARSHIVYLTREGQARDSRGLARWLEDRRQSGLDLCFVIGGAYGAEVPSAHEELSFGPITLPHQLARVVLLEQLYRAHSILANLPYHHGA
jgi:23S rRNA (pseudouridine1915-N3)-methyltransferase